MRRAFVISLVILSMATLQGCFKPDYPWSLVIVSSGYTTNTLSSSYDTFYADPGYDWRVITVGITNNRNYSQAIDYFTYKFTLRANDGFLYDNQLAYYVSIPGSFKWGDDIQPKQTVQGNIYFELPESISNLGGTVTLVDLLSSNSLTVFGIEGTK